MVARDPGAPALPGELAALGLLHAILHRIAVRLAERDPRLGLHALARAAEERAGRPVARRVATAWEREFPLAAAGAPALEELLLVRLANENPAAGPYRWLFDDRTVLSGEAGARLLAAIDAADAVSPAVGPGGETFLELLRAPARAAPTSLAGQLRFIRDRWRGMLGADIDALLDQATLILGVIDEEERALHQRFGGFTGGAGAGEAPGLGGEGDPERFSADRDWMPRVVLMAKSTYVWLDQLSRQHGRDIRTLDAIPDEELDRLAAWGITGLWLIGLWQRSQASERIKRMRGNPEAVASAYSLDDYRIADDLGGESGWANLRERAWARGIRLASDMVPNHMGVDSRWVVEHPERFLSLPESPYPAYTFSGADLSPDPRAAIRIEDHYWDGTDAAVVFQRVDTANGEARYIYHGNDGTSMPWNDTAQLDYLDPAVRESVVQAILDVARHFPIIRFDAAMTLAKRHIQRLWFPAPGAGGSIPSRAEHAIPHEAFEAAMPQEFWREVVDRVAAEAPDTLLLAEAFWLMEGYFVRTLGMHRVYNSAFMHMLRDEDNAGYRKVMRDTLEFDPEILKRYVNFMNNPDERTAVEQFGKGDKYIGVATVLATLPGLPMLGHGQVEGYAEKYGMEYRRAYHDEAPDRWLVERHEREVFPLLHRRRQFAEVRDFLLFDALRDDRSVDEDVFAYSNGTGHERSLVVYHNRYAETVVHIHASVPFSEPDGTGGRRVVRRTLAEGWQLPDGASALVRFRDHATGLEHLHRSGDVRARGLRFPLRAYERRVLLDVVDVTDGPAGLWSRLADRLAGGGVPSLEGAFRDLELEPVHGPLRHLLGVDMLGALVAAVAGEAPLADWVADESERRALAVLAALRDATGASGGTPDADIAKRSRARLERLIALASPLPADAPAAAASLRQARAAVAGQVVHPAERAALIAWALLEPLGRAGAAAEFRATTRSWLDELRLTPILADAFRSIGLDETDAWRGAGRIGLLVGLPRPLVVGGRPASMPAAIVDRALGNEDIRGSIRVNRWEGVEWFDRDAFEALVDAGVALDAIDAPWLVPTRVPGGRDPVTWGIGTSVRVGTAIKRAGEQAGYRVDRLVELAPTILVAKPRGRP